MLLTLQKWQFFNITQTSLSDFHIDEVRVSPTCQFKQSLDSFYVTDSPLSVTNIAEMAMFYIKLTSHDFPGEEEPVGQFKQSLDSFYVTDSLLAKMAMFYIKLTIHTDFLLEDEPVSRTGQIKQSLDSFYVTDSPSSGNL